MDKIIINTYTIFLKCIRSYSYTCKKCIVERPVLKKIKYI